MTPPRRGVIRSTRKRLAGLLIIVVATALATVASAPAVPQQIRDKRAEAERVLAEIQQIDAELELAVEAYNGATVRLDELEAEIELTQSRLAIARQSNRAAQRNLADRLIALYTNHEESTLEIVLGAASLDDLLDRLDSAQRISDQDVVIVEDVRAAKAAMRERERTLEEARAEQRQVVADRAARRDAIEATLREREALYASVQDELDRLLAEERERQQRIEEEAQRRLEAARAAASVAVPEGVAAVGIGTAPPSSVGGSVVSIAMQYLGVPYVWGGASPSGFDCSGFVVYVFAQAGMGGLPHYTGSLWQAGVQVSSDQLQAGDLVFFNGLGHVGIYIGGGQMVHAPHTGDVVKVSDITSGWYAATYVGAVRIG
jgi:cell wall-associated NlpC family hydrolase